MFEQLVDPSPPSADESHLTEVRRRANASIRRRRVGLASGLAVMVGAAVVYIAGLSDDSTTRTIAPAVTPSSGEETPSSASTPTTSTTLATTTTAGVGLGDEPPRSSTTASGSGCTPGGAELPDGWWYGRLRSDVADEVSFDLACYYVGDIAETEAAARGHEVDNDYYVVNDSPQLRTIPVAPNATASCVELAAALTEVECDPSEVGSDVPWAVWLRVQAGVVDRIVEQYAP